MHLTIRSEVGARDIGAQRRADLRAVERRVEGRMEAIGRGRRDLDLPETCRPGRFALSAVAVEVIPRRLGREVGTGSRLAHSRESGRHRDLLARLDPIVEVGAVA